MKLVFCKKLAACLCMKRSTSSSPEPRQIYKRRSSIPIGDRHSNGPHYNNATTPDAAPTRNETSDKVLQNILDLLKNQFPNEEEAEIKNDWMLAAAVVDRICAIVFTIIFIGITFIFPAVIATYGRASNGTLPNDPF